MLKPKAVITILILTIIEGLLGLFYLFSIPSMDKNASYFGFSLPRLVVGGIFVLIVICLVIALLWIVIKKNSSKTIVEQIEKYLIERKWLSSILVILFMIFIFCVFILYLNFSPISVHLNSMKFVIDRTLGLIVWITAIVIQLFIALFFTYQSVIKQKDFFDFSQIYKIILLVLMVFGSIAHWLILYFKIQLFASIPYWTWFFHDKTNTRDILLIPIIIVSTAVILIVLNKKSKIGRNLFLLVLLGYCIQIGFGFIEGEGFESIRTKAAEAGHVVYFEYAVDNPILSNAIVNYEEAYGWETWLGTKPPGVILFYIVSQKISNVINPALDYAGRFMRLTNFAAYVYPLITYLTIIPLFYLAKSISGSEDKAYYASILYSFFPNMVLMPLELDQVLFPLLLTVSLLLCWRLIKTYSLKWGFLTGIFIYFSLFFTFSLLPLVALIYVWLFLDFLIIKKGKPLKGFIYSAFAISLGIFFFYLILKITINYDIIIRFMNAMNHHTSLKEYESGLGQIFAAIKLNNLEIAAWIGFPIAFLLLSRLFRLIKTFIKNNIKVVDVFNIAVIIMYIILNVIGRTRGEVGRLWIFLLPIFSILVSEEITNLYKHKRTVLFSVIFLQLITTFMTFKFQDYF